MPWVNGTPVVPMHTSGANTSNAKAAGAPMRPHIKETATGVSQGKPNLLYFYWPDVENPAGAACAELNEKIWVNGKVCELAQEFICIKVNAKTCPRPVLQVFGITKYPTIIFQHSTEKVVTRITSKSVSEKTFAASMKACLRGNQRAIKALEAKAAKTAKAQRVLNGKIDKLLAKGTKSLTAGDLDKAADTFRDLIKKYPDSAQVAKATSGLAQIACRKQVTQGRTLLAAKKYTEATAILTQASECEVPCKAREEAKALLPDLAFAAQYDAACALLTAGKHLKAMEAFTKIAGHESYDGKYKALSEAKLKAMRQAWEQRTRSN
jgi:TolA-binding protein